MRTMLDRDAKQLKLDTKPHVFRAFLHWTYTNVLPEMEDVIYDGEARHIIGRGEDAQPKDMETYYYNQVEARYVDLYIFASTYDICKLRNDTFDVIYQFPYLSSYIIVLVAYERLPPTSPLLTYLVDIFAKEMTSLVCRPEKILCKKLPRGFLLSVLIKRTDKKFMRKKNKLTNCDYHEHAGDEKKSCSYFTEGNDEVEI